MMKAKPSLPGVPAREGCRRGAMLRFLGIFLATVAVYYALALSPWVDAKVLYPVMKVSARGTSALLNLMGVKTTVEGVVVRGADYSVAVRRGCDPLEPIVLFGAGVMAFPAPWRRKLPALVVASAFLFGMNVVRIVSLYLLGSNKSSMLETIHLLCWPAFFIICALALWVLWLRWIQRPVLALESAVQARTATPKPRGPWRVKDA
jgi:exosortase H (IPTLxxWG-CTERM-specific)